MKKIVLILICISFVLCNAFAEKSISAQQLFKSNRLLEIMWYIENDRNFYICLGYDDNEANGIPLYKYEAGSLIEVSKSEEEKKKIN